MVSFYGLDYWTRISYFKVYLSRSTTWALQFGEITMHQNDKSWDDCLIEITMYSLELQLHLLHRIFIYHHIDIYFLNWELIFFADFLFIRRDLRIILKL